MSCQPQRYLVSNCALGLFTTVEATGKHTHHDEGNPTQYNSCLSQFYSQLSFVILHSTRQYTHVHLHVVGFLLYNVTNSQSCPVVYFCVLFPP